MELVYTIDDIRRKVKEWKNEGLTVGLVPTMGFLHEGHGQLIKKAHEDNDKVVVSIFVNPIQFNSQNDLKNYPKDLESDKALVENMGGDIIFAPSIEEIYPNKSYSFVDTSVLDKNLCGATRPGHFRGVCTVVTKLFNIVAPHRAYFGKKDYQQLAIIKKMVEDLNIDVEIVACDTIRSKEGLALSSRNSLLTSKEREDALILIQAIEKVEESFKNGERDSKKLLDIAKNEISKVPYAKIDYINIVDAKTLEDSSIIEEDSLIAMAVFIGKTRLIDNRELII